MNAAEEARRWAELAGHRVAPPKPRTGLEGREAAPPDAVTPEEFGVS